MKGGFDLSSIVFSIKRKPKFDLVKFCCNITCSYSKDGFLSTKAGNATSSCHDSGDRVSEIAEKRASEIAEKGVSEVAEKNVAFESKSATEVLRKWGCSEGDLAQIFRRQPSLRNALANHLESKLNLLRGLGVGTSELVKMINCRPRFLSCRLSNHYEGLLELRRFIGSEYVFLKAITRNPSLLVYDFDKMIKPIFLLYEQMGISKDELISMLLLRPTLIVRSSFSEEKLEFIRRTGVSKESKMYKYVVTIIGVSRMETLREKAANLEKFGISEDEVLELFGRSPLVMTLSVEKVQRNMTFVVGSMKFPAKTIMTHPFLLFGSLEYVLKPRVLLAWKIQDMDLRPQMKGAVMLKALRMTEERLLKVFVRCHEQDVAEELYQYYQAAKGMKRLAQSSKKVYVTNGFPF